jgi:hypothetical protein
MPGILAIWNNIAPEGYEHFERWYNREHLAERVAVPGFHIGRRYEAVGSADRRFFGFYEVESPSVLTSAPYLLRLENPTPWTQKTMTYFRDMVRTVFNLELSRGDMAAPYAVVLRADGAFVPTAAATAFIDELAAPVGVARVQLWKAAAEQTKADTAEMQIRGRDRLAAGALVVECVRLADAERAAAVLAARAPGALGISGPSALGIYALLCMATPR